MNLQQHTWSSHTTYRGDVETRRWNTFTTRDASILDDDFVKTNAEEESISLEKESKGMAGSKEAALVLVPVTTSDEGGAMPRAPPSAADLNRTKEVLTCHFCEWDNNPGRSSCASCWRILHQEDDDAVLARRLDLQDLIFPRRGYWVSRPRVGVTQYAQQRRSAKKMLKRAKNKKFASIQDYFLNDARFRRAKMLEGFTRETITDLDAAARRPPAKSKYTGAELKEAMRKKKEGEQLRRQRTQDATSATASSSTAAAPSAAAASSAAAAENAQRATSASGSKGQGRAATTSEPEDDPMGIPGEIAASVDADRRWWAAARADQYHPWEWKEYWGPPQEWSDWKERLSSYGRAPPWQEEYGTGDRPWNQPPKGHGKTKDNDKGKAKPAPWVRGPDNDRWQGPDPQPLGWENKGKDKGKNKGKGKGKGKY